MITPSNTLPFPVTGCEETQTNPASRSRDDNPAPGFDAALKRSLQARETAKPVARVHPAEKSAEPETASEEAVSTDKAPETETETNKAEADETTLTAVANETGQTVATVPTPPVLPALPLAILASLTTQKQPMPVIPTATETGVTPQPAAALPTLATVPATQAVVNAPLPSGPTPQTPPIAVPQTQLPTALPTTGKETAPVVTNPPENPAVPPVLPTTPQQGPNPVTAVATATPSPVTAAVTPPTQPSMDSRSVPTQTGPGVENTRPAAIPQATDTKPPVPSVPTPAAPVAEAARTKVSVPSSETPVPNKTETPASVPTPQETAVRTSLLPYQASETVASEIPETTAETTEDVSQPQAVVSVPVRAADTLEQMARQRVVGDSQPVPSETNGQTTPAPTLPAPTVPARNGRTAALAAPEAAPVVTFSLAPVTAMATSPLNTALNGLQERFGLPQAIVSSGTPKSVLETKALSTPEPILLASSEAVPIAQTAASGQMSQEQGQNPQPQSQAHTSAPQTSANPQTAPDIRTGTTTEARPVSPANGQTGDDTTLDRGQVIRQVTRHLETMRLTNGRGEIALRLTPEHLGTLHLKITQRSEGVVARILTETAQVQHVMQTAKEDLRAALESRGLNLAEMQVSVGQGSLYDGRSAFGAAYQTPQERGLRPGSGRAASALATDTSMAAAAESRLLPLDTTARLDYRA